MDRILKYLKAGSGRGLRLVLVVALLISALFGTLTYYTGSVFIEHPAITQFVDSIPSFSIKDGIVQEKNIQWKSYIPLTNIPVTVDTTMENLALPAPDGLYLTNRFMYLVSKHGTQSDRSEFTNDIDVSPAYAHEMLKKLIISFSVGIMVFVFIVSWIIFLIAVGVSALLGFLLRMNLSNKRVWRIAAVTWAIGQLICLGLALLGYVVSGWVVCGIGVLINMLILAKLKD